MLHEFVTENREEIIRRCRTKLATRSVSPPTGAQADHGVPMFLDQLVDDLRLGLSSHPAMNNTATQHGHDLLRRGFTASQVVHDYGDICQSITELAMESDASITPADFRTLNRCLDDAIASAVTKHGQERDQDIGGAAAGEMERILALALELRASVHTAGVAFDAITTGRVGVEGSTGTVLKARLSGAHNLVDRLVDEIRAARPTIPTRSM